MYGLQILGTNFEEGTACFAAVRCIYFLLVRFSGLYGLHLIQEEEEGCTAGLLSTFPDFEIKFAGEDKLYFSPFFVLYIAEENNKNLSSL